MKIAIGSDHAGLELKAELAELMRERGIEVEDVGPIERASVDYPDFAREVAARVADGRAALGVLVCGTGQGMAMAANKVAGVRAAVVADPFSARMTREHNDCNVLCMGQRVVGGGLARTCLEAWLDASFEGGRHARRVGKISALER
jgi:ribose 5-phosphate isomerase B